MGPLIFVARKHQIQRKKSQLNMRLMKIQNQREKIAEQIGQAQQAKTARQNLFNSTNRMVTNALTSALSMQNMLNQYSNNQALFSALNGNNMFGGTNNLFRESIEVKNGEYVFKEGAFSALPADLSGASNGYYLKDGKLALVNNGQVMKEGIDPNAFVGMTYQKQQNDQSNLWKQQMLMNMDNMNSNFTNQLALQSINNASSLMSNMFNTLSNLSDEAELESLNAIDSQLEQEQTTVETQIKMLEAELQSVDKQLDNEIKQSAPKFSLGG